MNAEHQTLHMPEDLFNQPEDSAECFSPISNCVFLSPADRRLFQTSQCFFSLGSSTPQVSRKVFLDDNDSDCETPRKRSEESDKVSEDELSRRIESRMLSHTFAGETDHVRPMYRNNVSPAIQKIIRMMRMPCLSHLENTTSPRKRTFSAGRLGCLINRLEDKVSSDDSICNLTKFLDESFNPDLASRRHSIDSHTMRMMLARDNSSSMFQVTQNVSLPTRQPCDFAIAVANDELVANASCCEMKQSPVCVQIVKKEEDCNEVSSEDRNQVSELYFLLMKSNRNRRMKNAAFRRWSHEGKWEIRSFSFISNMII